MDIFKEAREFCMERLEPEFLSEEEEKAYREAAEGTPEWEDYLKTWKAWKEAYEAVLATPEGKAEKEAWDAVKATPEWKDFLKTGREALKARVKDWEISRPHFEPQEYQIHWRAADAVMKTPEYKDWEKAEKAYREAVAGTPKGKARKEAWRAYWVAYTVHAVRWRSEYNGHI